MTKHAITRQGKSSRGATMQCAVSCRSVQIKRFGSRRGAALVAVVVLLSMINLTVVASMKTQADQGDIAALRIESERAFYAAESGAVVLLGELLAGGQIPETGDTLDLGTQTVTFTTVAESGTGTAEISGRSGRGSRRIAIEID